jgi:hypothetical protein
MALPWLSKHFIATPSSFCMYVCIYMCIYVLKYMYVYMHEEQNFQFFCVVKQLISHIVWCKSKSHYDRRPVGQCALVSSPVWGSWPDANCCLTVTVLSISGAPSDERSGLSFVLVTWTASVQYSKFAAGPRRHSISPYLSVCDVWLILFYYILAEIPGVARVDHRTKCIFMVAISLSHILFTTNCWPAL